VAAGEDTGEARNLAGEPLKARARHHAFGWPARATALERAAYLSKLTAEIAGTAIAQLTGWDRKPEHAVRLDIHVPGATLISSRAMKPYLEPEPMAPHHP